MILGLSIPAFVALHVAISLIGIVTGLIALPLLARGRKPGTLHIAFLATTLATTLTGFLFPFGGITPAIVTGIVSTLVLAVAIGAFARNASRTYAVSATIALYLNLFVLVVQSFLKVPALHALAPTGTEPAFLFAQGFTLAGGIALGALAYRGTRGLKLATI
jgi:hypothetical protein